jgi:hypothetical protein
MGKNRKRFFRDRACVSAAKSVVFAAAVPRSYARARFFRYRATLPPARAVTFAG